MAASLALDKIRKSGRVREALATGSHIELLKALVEAFPGNWFFTRMDATFAFVNQNACDALGYTREELMALTLFDIDPTMTQEMWDARNSAVNFKPASLRTFHRRKDGSVFPVEAFASRIFLGDERVSVSHVIDLSEEAQARQALAEKQHLLQSLLDNAPVVVWYVDLDGRFQLSEGSALSLVGSTPGLAVGMTVKEVFPMRAAEIVEATERALKGHPVEGMFSTDNAEFEYRYLPRRDEAGKVIGATGVAIDITARRSAERAKLRLMTAFEQAEDAVLLLDREGRVEYANAAFERASGTAKVHMLGRPWPELLPKGCDDTRARAELAQAIADGTAWRGTLRGVGESQDERVLQANLSPFHNGDGSLTGFVAGSRDITEQTRTEDRLRQVEKMDALGQLAGGVAHDFNNLLQIVQGNADLCLQLVPEPVQAMLVEIHEAGRRAASLVKQLLSFSKIATEPKSIALDGLLDRMLPLLRRLLGEHILIQVGPRGGGFDVWGDESQLEQIVVNLCVNARDAMPKGGKLDLELSRCSIGEDQLDKLGLSSPGVYIALEVTDTGCGMNDEIRRRAFEPFFTTKEPGVGTGLGLATVYAVAKRHGGSVELWSTVGKGTRFRVLLRQSERSAETPEPQLQGVSRPNRHLRVLLAENDPAVRKITRRFLTAAGHDVVEVGDGQEAVSLIKVEGQTFDLLVLDAIMPQVNGPEVYKMFRSLSPAPVLFVTGHDFNVLAALPHDRARALLHKPFGPSELTNAIAQLIQASHPSNSP